MIATLDEVKTYLGVSGTDDDAFLTAQVAAVSEAIEEYTRRKFNKSTYKQTFYASDYGRILKLPLSIYPVDSITSVTEDELLVNDYRIHKDTGTLMRSCGFLCGVSSTLEVVFVAGYDQDKIPAPLKSVVYSVVQERYNKKKSGIALDFGSDVQRVSIPGTISIDFDYTLSNNDRSTPFGALIGNYLNVLDNYRSDRAILGAGKLEYVDVVS